MKYLEFKIFEQFKPKLQSFIFTRKAGNLPGNIVSVKQWHGDNILVVDKLLESEPENYDAMITDKKGLYLMIKVADCQAVCMYDSKKQVIANVHNGWRGSAQNIVGKTIKEMKERFGSDPKDIFVGISPSLGPCHAEFSDPYKELPEHLHPYILKNNHVDFWKATIDQCFCEGIPKNQIEPPEICTFCRSDMFFSYRKEKDEAGRFGVAIGLNC